jgi:hypothetical protein
MILNITISIKNINNRYNFIFLNLKALVKNIYTTVIFIMHLKEKKYCRGSTDRHNTERQNTAVMCLYHINVSLPLLQDLIHLSAAYKFNGAG